MASRIILCADIGSSALKAAFINSEGRQLAFAREVYTPIYTVGTASVPVSAGDWERAFTRAMGKLFSQAPDCRPDAICISGNGPTLAPLTRDGETLALLHWYQGPLGSTAPGSPSGDLPVIRSFYLPHALGFLRERPGEYEKTRYLLSSQEWLSWRLGADPVTVLPEGYGPYYWDDEQCRALGIDPGKFPPFVSLGSVIGRLSQEAAQRLGSAAAGLPAGIPIIAGGSDFIMALIGAGTVEKGMVCDRAGSSEGINCCDLRPEETASARDLRVLPHVSPGLWNVSVIIPSSGRLFEWYRTLTGQDGRPYEDILGELIPEGLLPSALSAAGSLSSALSPAGGDQGALFFPGKTAALFGKGGLFSRTDLGRAVLEAMGYQVRDALETLGRHGFPVGEMRLSGGQSRNRRWNQLKADMTGAILLVPELGDGELGGDAALGLMTLGDAANLKEAIGRIVHIQERYEPDPATAAVYGERFQTWRELREKAGPFNEML
ncbi:carhohydrate kinase, fggy family [Treponema primitia ZAS-2]|uniref:Carhohydrate kinase, fggy family n=1 Tax=Treponema primitia (strain ATCC BAA-887 / DSM 12427 / ZAS-2) TaxID=545694 RepID=F5YQX5_TREPZ|nr:FGGY family carbohydrate kinase [Treponema primitia]AEF84477.1 carhohydrate kinase, fggy family [Treponema primitia ZAS-2]